MLKASVAATPGATPTDAKSKPWSGAAAGPSSTWNSTRRPSTMLRLRCCGSPPASHHRARRTYSAQRDHQHGLRRPSARLRTRHSHYNAGPLKALTSHQRGDTRPRQPTWAPAQPDGTRTAAPAMPPGLCRRWHPSDRPHASV